MNGSENCRKNRSSDGSLVNISAIQFWPQLSIFWKFQLLGWIAFVAVSFPLKYAIAGNTEGAILLILMRDGTSFLLTLALRSIYRSYWSNKGARMAVLTIVACTIGGIVQYIVVSVFRPYLTVVSEIQFTHPMIFDIFYERTGLLFAWSFLYCGIRYALTSTQQELRLALIESESRQAQLQMLRAQVNPHFLFNALNSIRSNVESANAELGRMVQSLSDFLRFSLDHSYDNFIPLGREFDAMRDYLAVEKIRFRDKLDFHCEIHEQACDILVPGIILQPLVENAVKYGLETSEPPLRITIHVARRDAVTLQITVSNSGAWLEPVAREKESHLGLQNLRRRLGLIYPDKYSLEITSRNGWVTLTILLPI